jgi:hypothetical protein
MLTKEDEAACMAVLDRWMDALNAHDARAMDREMRFPHVRLAGGKLVVYDKAGSNPMDFFQKLISESGWSHSTWDKRSPVQTNPTKVHMAVTYTRFRADRSVIGVYDSMYIMTKQDNEWKVQIRSSDV